MIRRCAELAWAGKQGIRGGVGRAAGADYLRLGDMAGIVGAGRTVLEPGSSIGAHAHPSTEELYLILEGHGLGNLDGERFPVGPGDLFVVKAGHTHGLENPSASPLVFFGLLTRQETRKDGADPDAARLV